MLTVADLQAGFVESLRLRIAALLASAPWERLARLRHARVTHVMSGDIQRAGMAAHLLLQNMVAAAMLLAQGVLILLLAPILALLALGVLDRRRTYRRAGDPPRPRARRHGDRGQPVAVAFHRAVP